MARCLHCGHEAWGNVRQGICSICWDQEGQLLAMKVHYELRGMPDKARELAGQLSTYRAELEACIQRGTPPEHPMQGL